MLHLQLQQRCALIYYSYNVCDQMFIIETFGENHNLFVSLMLISGRAATSIKIISIEIT